MKQKLLNTLTGGVLRTFALMTLFLTLGVSAKAATESFIIPTTKTDGANNNIWPNSQQYTGTIVTTENVAGVKWTASAFSNNNWGWEEMRCGRNANASSPCIYNNQALEYEVSKVIVNTEAMKAWAGLSSAKLYVSSDSKFSTGDATVVYEFPVISDIATTPATQVATLPSSASKGAKYAFEFSIPTPKSNQYYKIEFNIGSSNKSNGCLGINKLEFEYQVSDDLGGITYGSESAEGLVLNAVRGDTFTFTAKNAENMAISATPANGVISNFENGEIMWTAPAVTEEVEYTLTVTATKGDDNKTATVKVKVAPAPLCSIPPLFDPMGGSVVTGTTVSISCENAVKIKYWFDDENGESTAEAIDVNEEGKVVTTPITKVCTLYALGINADGIAGSPSSVSFTEVKVPTSASFNFRNADVIKNAYDGTDLEALNSQTSSNALDGKTLKLNGVKIAFAKNSGSNDARWWQNSVKDGGETELRLYSLNTMNVTAPEGCVLMSIEFTIRDKFNLTASTGSFNSNHIWTPTATRANESNVTSVVFSGSGTNNIYAINVDFNTPTGIKDIVAGTESGEAVYYNLQGVRVDNPVKGLYIRVANGKSCKVIL